MTTTSTILDPVQAVAFVNNMLMQNGHRPLSDFTAVKNFNIDVENDKDTLTQWVYDFLTEQAEVQREYREFYNS